LWNALEAANCCEVAFTLKIKVNKRYGLCFAAKPKVQGFLSQEPNRLPFFQSSLDILQSAILLPLRE
jgi:hypothetical protein